MTTLADDLVPDELWAIVEPLLPAPPRPRCVGCVRAGGLRGGVLQPALTGQKE
jgi:hypothetical protein